MYHHHPPDPSCSSNAQVHVATKVTIMTDGPGGLQYSQVIQTAPYLGADGRFRAPTTHIYQQNLPPPARLICSPLETWEKSSKRNAEESRPVIYTPTETSERSSRKKAEIDDDSSTLGEDGEDQIVINTFEDIHVISKESTVEQILEKRNENDQVVEFCKNLRKIENYSQSPGDTVAEIVKSLIKPVENVTVDHDLEADEESTIEIKTTVNKTRRKLAPKIFETLIDDKATESIGVQTDDDFYAQDQKVQESLSVENTVYETIAPKPTVRRSLKPSVTLYDEVGEAAQYEYNQQKQYSDSTPKIAMETTFPVEPTFGYSNPTVIDTSYNNAKKREVFLEPTTRSAYETGFLEKPSSAEFYRFAGISNFPVQNLTKEPSSKFSGLQNYDERQRNFRRRDLYTVAEISETTSSSKRSSTTTIANDDDSSSIDNEKSSLLMNLNKNYANETLEEECLRDYMQDHITSYMEDLKFKMNSSDAETLSRNSLASSTSLKAENSVYDLMEESTKNENDGKNRRLERNFDDILCKISGQKLGNQISGSSTTVWSSDDSLKSGRSTLIREANLINQQKRSNEKNRRAIMMMDENSKNEQDCRKKDGKFLKQTAL